MRAARAGASRLPGGAARARDPRARLRLVTIDPVPPGNFGYEEELGRRVCRALAWIRPYPGGNSYARPIEGIVGLVDLHKGEVIGSRTTASCRSRRGRASIAAAASGRCATISSRSRSPSPRARASRRRQPDPLAEVVVPRRLHRARGARAAHRRATTDQGRCGRSCTVPRSAEMAVPYGDPRPNRLHRKRRSTSARTASGRWPTRSSSAATASARSATSTPTSSTAERRAVHDHERDLHPRGGRRPAVEALRTSATATPRCAARAGFVISFISTVGNYDYGFYWYLYQDGTIEPRSRPPDHVDRGRAAGRDAAARAGWSHEGLNAIGPPALLLASGWTSTSTGREHRLRGRDRCRRRPGRQPVRQRVRAGADAAAGESEAARDVNPLRPRTWYVVNRGQAQRLGRADGLQADPRRERPAVRPPGSR